MKRLNGYRGDERMALLFLVFETLVLLALAGLVRSCCIFWRKKKLQVNSLGSFLEKRRSLQLKKKAFDRTITELKQRTADEAVADNLLQEIGSLVQERKTIQRKLSTTYSLGRDKPVPASERLLPLRRGEMRSYSFQDARKESVTTIFHTLSSETSSAESGISISSSGTSSGRETGKIFLDKGKAPLEEDSLSSSSSEQETTRSSGLGGAPVNAELEMRRGDLCDSRNNERKSSWLKRRRALSSTN